MIAAAGASIAPACAAVSRAVVEGDRQIGARGVLCDPPHLHRRPDGDASAEQRRCAVEREVLGHTEAELLVHYHARAVAAVGDLAVLRAEV